MEKIELEIVSLSHSVTQNQNYAVVLAQIDSDIKLPIVIGGSEAQAIALAIENMSAPRPLTHDLFVNVLQAYGVNIQEVIISNLLEGIFYAKLICDLNGNVIEIDSRTSDAIALAARFNCPIYTYSHILDEAGVVFSEKTSDAESSVPIEAQEKPKESIKIISIEQLEADLEKALSKEDYETAALIRDEIQRRKDLG